MDLAFENYLAAQDNNLIEPEDIPKTNSPVWILGRQYNAIQGNYYYLSFIIQYVAQFGINDQHFIRDCSFIFDFTELDLIRRDVQSRIWCTYRKGFVPLGRPQLTTDRGWGCMLRCGEYREINLSIYSYLK